MLTEITTTDVDITLLTTLFPTALDCVVLCLNRKGINLIHRQVLQSN
jgi:hypothetical protein